MDTAYQSDWAKLRAQQLFEKSQDNLYRNADQLFKILMFLQLGLMICVAFLVTPTTWIGENPVWHIHVIGAVLLGSILTATPFYLTRVFPAAPLTRHAIAICQIGWSVLFIHMAGGRVRNTFSYFRFACTTDFLSRLEDSRYGIYCGCPRPTGSRPQLAHVSFRQARSQPLPVA